MRRFQWSVLVVMASVLCGGRAAAREASVRRLDGSRIKAAAIDALVSQLMTEHKVAGAGIVLFERGRVAYIKAYGLRDVEKGLPMTPDSVMTAASLTKAAFATTVMQLVAEGRIDLDRPVVRYLAKPLGEYEGYADLAGDARADRITMRMLLSHTSGLPNLRRFTEDGKLHLQFEPGSRYAYSGEGILLGQMVVEQVTGEALGALMKERLFVPLGMTRTEMKWEPRFEDNFANRYDEKGESLGPERRKRADAAGSMKTTVRDYGRFLEGVMTGTAVPAGARAEMLRPQVRIRSAHQFPTFSTEMTTANDAIALSYGLGWGLFTTRDGKAFFKEGHDDGWRHYAVCFERSGRGLLMMTNSSNGEEIFDGLLKGLLKDDATPLVWEGYPAEAVREEGRPPLK